MIKRVLLPWVALPLVLLSIDAQAVLGQEPQPERFQMEKTETGFVRLNRETGAVSLCRDDGGNLVCRMAADERAAYERELDLLEKRVTALERKLESTPRARTLPGEAEIEQSFSIMERFMRRFMEIIEDFTSERDHSQPDPQKT
jgi:hypothetical protein